MLDVLHTKGACHGRATLHVHPAGSCCQQAAAASRLLSLLQSGPQELEAFYTEVHAREARLPIFPQAYPTSCLLGCVDIIDCLPVSAVVN